MTTEYSELHAVDIAFGGHVLSAFSDLAVAGPSEFKEFLARDPKKQVFRHDSDSVQGFLKSYMASGNAVDTISEGKQVRSARLPVVNYSRQPGLVSDDENPGGIYNRLKILFNEDTGLNVKVLSVILSYRLVFIARDKPTLDKFVLAWLSRVSDTKHRGHKFETRHLIGDQELDITAMIKNPKMHSFDNESVTTETGHFFAAGTMVEIETPVLFGEVVTVYDPMQIEYIGRVMENA
jgi:hypothetical protein